MKQKQRIFSLFLLVALVFSLAAPVSAAGEMNFTDVAPDDWYYTYVKDLYDNDIVHGTTPTTFSPQGQVTLGEALKLVLMSAGYGDQISTVFKSQRSSSMSWISPAPPMIPLHLRTPRIFPP